MRIYRIHRLVFACALGILFDGSLRAERTISKDKNGSAEKNVRSFTDLQSFAERLAAQDYRREPPLAGELAKMEYEQYSKIHFKHEKAIWADGDHPFWLEFFHRGFVQQDRIDCYLIPNDPKPQTNPEVTEVTYSPDQFRFGDQAMPLTIPDSVGFAGIRIAGRFSPDGDPQELLTFIGSSYFRARTGQTVYGTSARGLAVDVGMNQDEEFPDFRKFWVVEPSSKDRDIRILALLDSPSLTGAYQFDFRPSETVSKMNVKASLYFRKSPSKLAIAPLTSMWIWGDGLEGPPLDLRPSVHDADGLLIHADDQWQWRSFARLPYPSVSSIRVDELQGFGLLQRDRIFLHYDDYNARYHDRPSVWVRPIKDFGKGRIELLEIPGAHEGIDNIGAYFVADEPTDIHQPLHLNYQTFFFRDEAELPVFESGPELTAKFDCLDVDRRSNDSGIRLEITFRCNVAEDGDQDEDEVVATDPTESDEARAKIQTIRGEVKQQSVNRTESGYQVDLTIVPTEAAPIELELTLLDSQSQPISETFRYLCPHEQPTFVYPSVYTRKE
ncbi:glucan biosynthesis protein [Neorhodopirellula pilleata]|uniref:Glucans biosynthesis protein G n=1 Tax=Neorhodopirellula pilleata TaxID=2714738 RepID=A0A5C5ZLC4_9BACT|nr:glucan biosynthesis protein [Neorhodopirellula pilleata]TWT87777.1 Glucans biosynthesis protein G precursor [Neorhodopirellula pilleata]